MGNDSFWVKSTENLKKFWNILSPCQKIRRCPETPAEMSTYTQDIMKGLLMVRFGVIQALKMLAVDDNILNCKKQLMYSTVKENNKKRVVPSSHKNIRQ